MNANPSRIWIVRRGNGKAEVSPSPVVLRPGERFAVFNATEAPATVTFPPGRVDPPSAPVAPGTATDFTLSSDTVAARLRHAEAEKASGKGSRAVTVFGPWFFEYEVELDSGHYAEGGSRPGVIVDG